VESLGHELSPGSGRTATAATQLCAHLNLAQHRQALVCGLQLAHHARAGSGLGRRGQLATELLPPAVQRRQLR
jgi:hypothetical protein